MVRKSEQRERVDSGESHTHVENKGWNILSSKTTIAARANGSGNDSGHARMKLRVAAKNARISRVRHKRREEEKTGITRVQFVFFLISSSAARHSVGNDRGASKLYKEAVAITIGGPRPRKAEEHAQKRGWVNNIRETAIGITPPTG